MPRREREPAPALLPGTTVAMGGRDWIVPPLTLGQLRRLLPKVRQLTAIDAQQMDEAQIGVLAEIVAAALSRNYPDMTAESAEELLDLGNAGTVLTAVLTGSGLKAPRPGEAEARSLGVPSMDSSPHLSAIAPVTSTS